MSGDSVSNKWNGELDNVMNGIKVIMIPGIDTTVIVDVFVCVTIILSTLSNPLNDPHLFCEIDSVLLRLCLVLSSHISDYNGREECRKVPQARILGRIVSFFRASCCSGFTLSY